MYACICRSWLLPYSFSVWGKKVQCLVHMQRNSPCNSLMHDVSINFCSCCCPLDVVCSLLN